MRRRLVLSYLLLAILLLAGLEIPLAIGYQAGERRDITTRVERDAVSLASLSAGLLRASSDTSLAHRTQLERVAETARSYSDRSGARITIVDGTGAVVIDTAEDPAVVPRADARSFRSRPEVADALAGNVATGARHSDTLGDELLYVAVPVAADGVVLGAVRITYPLEELRERVYRYWLALAGIGLLAVLGSLVTALLFARWALAPLRRLLDAARAVRDGDLSARAYGDDGPRELVELAAEFDRMVVEVSNVIHAQGQFVADASHQLRSPMTGLRLSLEAALAEAQPSLRPSLEGSLVELERLGGIVDGLLVLARAPESAELVEVDVAAIARERAAAWEGLAAERQVMIDVAVTPSAHACAVAGTIDQVIDNLVDNSLGVAPAGSTIHIDVRPRGARLELRVTDAGPGMTDAEIEQAFGRFWQGSVTTGSSGLGLAIVQRLVELSGGTVHLEHARADGRGLAAVVELEQVLSVAER